jgi:hypothetical protein
MPASGKKKPQFMSGRAATHSMMRSKMREVLLGNEDFRYLDATATRMLAGARHDTSLVGLSREPFLPLGKRHSALLLWTGDQIDMTLHLLLRAAGADIESQPFSARRSDGTPSPCAGTAAFGGASAPLDHHGTRDRQNCYRRRNVVNMTACSVRRFWRRALPPTGLI